MKEISARMQAATIYELSSLSADINNLYGYVYIPGDNFGEPAINSGPCAPFAKFFFDCRNKRFSEKVNIVFIMVKNSDECWHTLIRLPNGQLYDGGYGLHDDMKYRDQFDIQDMLNLDINPLEKMAYGMDRTYPRYCPDYSAITVKNIIEKHLLKIDPENI